jgi:hypothetical protein
MASGRRLAGRQRLWLAGAEKAWRDYLDVILDLIGNMGEMASINTNAALYEGDPAPRASTRGLHPPTKRRPRSRPELSAQSRCHA